jgi:hypothetical protein
MPKWAGEGLESLSYWIWKSKNAMRGFAEAENKIMAVWMVAWLAKNAERRICSARKLSLSFGLPKPFS